MNKRILLVLMLSLMFGVLIVEGVFAEVNSDVDLTLSASSGYSSSKIRTVGDYTDYWFLSGNTRFLYTLSGRTDSVRGQVRMEVLGNEVSGLLFELSRAYVRKRMKLGTSYAMQLELGKNTVAWGEGDYYNAGDVIFGADPKITSKTSSTLGGLGTATQFRDFAFWQARILFPINTASYVEALLGIPDQKYSAFPTSHTSSGYAGGIVAPTTDLKETGGGARLHVEIKPLQLEVGAYSRYIQNVVSPYISLALPLRVRMYVANGLDIDYSKNADTFMGQLEEKYVFSMGALSTFNVGDRGTLTTQAEGLFQNYVFKVQVQSTWFFTRVFGILFRGNMVIENQEYTLVFGPQWIPETGFTIGLYSNIALDFNDNSDTNTLYAGGSVMMHYKF